MYNKGKMRLMQNMSTGGRLPFETSAVLFYRKQQTQVFVNAPGQNKERTVTMNSLRYPVGNLTEPANGIELNKYQWMQQFRNLYQEYAVTGAKLLVEIKPMLWPSQIATTYRQMGIEEGTQPQDYVVPLDAAPGYWYIRVNYRKANDSSFTDQNMTVGAFMNTPVTATQASAGTERIWTTRRDFLSDPSVSYVRDKTVIRQKLHATVTAPAIHGAGISDLGHTVWTNPQQISNSDQQISYEIEKNTKKIILKQYFSHKKHFGDNNLKKKKLSMVRHRYNRSKHANTNKGFVIPM